MQDDASLLSLLTIETENGEEIVFAYLKELHEIPPPNIIWYSGKGKDGKAKFIWKEKKLRQWLLIGSDKEVNKIWNSFLLQHKYTERWNKSTSVTFIMAPVDLIEDAIADSATHINEIPPFNPDPILYKRNDFSLLVSFLIDEKSNCNFIEGNKYHPLITPIDPPGLFPENSLYDHLKEKVIAAYQRREMFYYMEEKTLDGAQKILRGFIQKDSLFRKSHYIEIKTLDGDKTIGISNIQEETGKWEIESNNADGQGQFLLVSHEDRKVKYGEKFYILRHLNIQQQVVHTVITDLYGRKITLTDGGDRTALQSIESVSWDASLYPDTKQAEMELSDKIASVLLSLGSDIIISDPYFLGDLTEKDGGLQFSSRSQLIFLNALLTAIGKGCIETVTVIGYWQRAKKLIQGDIDRATFISHYKLISSLIESNYKNYPKKKLKKFDMVFSASTFHDRYWLNTSILNAVCYHVSNSVNGPFEQKEFSIRLQNSIDAFKEKTKILRRIKDGKTEKLL